MPSNGTPISEYNPLTSVQPDDLLPIVDVHDPAGGTTGNGTTKKITVANLTAGLGGGGINPPAGDIGGTVTAPTVVSTHLSAALPIAQGGTGQTAQQAALDALAGAVTSGQVLRGNGTHVQLAALQAGDIPQLADYAPTGLTGATAATRYAGATASGAPVSGTFTTGDFVIDQTGKVWICTAPGTPGTWTAAGPQIPVTIAQGGTGQVTAPAALSALGGLPLVGGTMTGALVPAVVPLTFGATIAVNAALGNVFAVTLTASTGTLANPTNPVDGQAIRVRVIQDATGGRTLSYGTAYDFGTAGQPALTSTPSKTDILGFEYVASLSKWCYLGSALGF